MKRREAAASLHPSSRDGSAVRDYAIAIGCIIIGASVRWALTPYVGNKYPYSSLLLAVVVASTLRGWRAGTLATILAWLIGNYFFLSPNRTIFPETPELAINGFLFMFNCLVVVVLSESLIRMRDRAESTAADLSISNAVLEKRVQERTNELSKANSELTFANNELEGFTYSVSHDLRSPLRSIIATSMILQEELGDDLSDEHRNLLRQQASSSKKLAILIDELLQLSRVSRHDIQRKRIDLTAMTTEVAEQRVADAKTGVALNVEPGLFAIGDPTLLHLVLVNLIDNAIKFSPDGGTIWVGKTETDRGTAFFVRDSGVGFDMRYAGKLFKPFERLHKDVEFPGTGIGLANVQRSISRHGGEVWIESELGQGTTVFFTLPQDDQESASASLVGHGDSASVR